MNIETIASTKQACSLTEKQEKHAQRIALRAGVPVGEPLPRLTKKQMDQYSNVLHQNSGLPPQDARRLFKTVKRRYSQADEVEQTRIAQIVNSAIEGLKPRALETVPPGQPITVFKRS